MGFFLFRFFYHEFVPGPKHCDIFTKTAKYASSFTIELLENASKIQVEVLKLLSEPVPRPSDSVKQQVSKRCQALASFMESLMDEVKRHDLRIELSADCEATPSEHCSVMLGEISPHHHSDHDDSKSSSETPPTYNQLNYYENLNRFFNSQPATFVPDDTFKIDFNPIMEKSRMLSPVQVIIVL